MADAELRTMIMNFRVSDLVVLLSFAGRNKSGKKQELQSRALDLIKLKSTAVQHKIRELHNRRYNHQLLARPNNYEIPERTNSDRTSHHYDGHVNNSYATRYNPNIRPPVNQHPAASYSTGKPYITPPPLSSVSSVPHLVSYVGVKFKDLPFYDVLYEIQKPSNLVNSINDRYQETTFYFTLTAQQANDVAVSRDSTGNYGCQILLRFCLLETSCEQEDNFPPSVCVKVNGKLVPLPNPIPTNRPGVEPKRPSKPVNMTSLSKLAPSVSNMITISWSATYGRSYVVAIYVARQLTSSTLLCRLKNTGIRSPDITTNMIREKLQQNQDCEIATTSLCGSLICPLGKVKMELPCRAITCTHIQCFDASLYIQMNEKKPKWICPVCDKPALFRTLAIDGLFMDIAAKLPAGCTEVQFNEDGSWTPVMPKKDPKELPKADEDSSLKKKTKEVEVVDLSDNESDETWSYINPENNTADNFRSFQLPSLTPPLVSFSPDSPNITSNSYVPTSSHCFSPCPETLQAVANIPDNLDDSICILPDTSMPSTSSISSNLGIPLYPHLPYIKSTYGNFNEHMGMSDNQSLNQVSDSFDLFSLLNIPDGDSEKSRECEKRDTHNQPDVISLD